MTLIHKLIPDEANRIEELWQDAQKSDSDLEFRQRLLNRIRRATMECTRCTLCKNRTVTVRSDGSVYADLFVIGEGPGYAEDLSGYPLVCHRTIQGSPCYTCSKLVDCHGHLLRVNGRSFHAKPTQKPTCIQDNQGEPIRIDSMHTAGQLLGDMLDELGLPRRSWGERESKVLVSNVVRCHSVASDGISNATPSPLHVQTCIDWLKLEALIVQPKITILMGNTARDGILGKEIKLNQYSEQWFQRKPPFGIVMLTVHPSYLLRQGRYQDTEQYRTMYHVFQYAIWCIKNGIEPNPKESPYLINGNNKLPEDSFLSFDESDEPGE